MSRPKTDPVQRILAKIKINKITDCEEFTGYTNKDGYGHILNGTQRSLVHRLMAEFYYTKIKPGEVVRHLCNNRKCVKKEHLKIGTQKENIADIGLRITNATITENEVRLIRTEFSKGGISKAALGRKYNITGSAVYYIVTGKSWSHVI